MSVTEVLEELAIEPEPALRIPSDVATRLRNNKPVVDKLPDSRWYRSRLCTCGACWRTVGDYCKGGTLPAQQLWASRGR